MNRGGPLPRRTELKRTGLDRKQPQLEQRRTLLPRVSAKRRKANVERRQLLADIAENRGGRCQAPDCWMRADDGHEPLTRARAGGRLHGPGSITDADNVVLLCRMHHDLLGQEPAWAYDLGLLRHSWEV